MARGFTALGAISVIASSITVLVQIIFIILLSYSFVSKTDTKYFKSIRFAALGTFISLALSFISWIIEECMYRLHHNSNAWVPWYLLFFVLISLSLMLFYVLMLLKVYHSFHNTSFQINHITLKMHIIMVILVAILGPTIIIDKIISGNNMLYWILTCVLMVVYGFGLLHLIYLLNKKLYSITVSIQENNDKQLIFIATIRRQTLLASIMLTMIFCNLFIIIIYIFTNSYVFWTIGWCITFNIWALCVFLGFGENQSRYYACCSKCDNLFEKFCDSIADNRHLQQHARLSVKSISRLSQVSNIAENQDLE
eukprot:384429_1